MPFHLFYSIMASLLYLTFVSCSKTSSEPTDLALLPTEQLSDTTAITIGERLFLETRFAQFFSANNHDINTPLSQGDPTLAQSLTTTNPIPSPFAGKTMNCAFCHLVDQQLEQFGGGMRSYSDFARRPPVPDRSDRGDTRRFAVRNTQSLVGINAANEGVLLHFDGEFLSMPELIKATLTGRNFGWLSDEQTAAIHHIAEVIRQDNGQGALAQEFGGAYRKILTGTRDDIPTDFVLPRVFRIEVATATDAQIVDAVTRLISAYVNDLAFSTDEHARFNGSPYDVFLARNGLDQVPNDNESDLAYATRLLGALDNLLTPKWVIDDNEDHHFDFHDQEFMFGESQLRGLKIFLTQPLNDNKATSAIGNCVSCHAPPHFTDFKLHNTGATQLAYDDLHGEGSFISLMIPDLHTRNNNHDRYLPPTVIHPSAQGQFRSFLDLENIQQVDLGVWNIFANPDFPQVQDRLRQLICEIETEQDCLATTDELLLERSIASFKTPSLRDLGHSAPFMHNGALDTIEDVVLFYQERSTLSRESMMRNPDPQMSKIFLDDNDIEDLSSFLHTLNEDYE